MEQPATFWMMEPLRKYATFTGRARRAEYWWFYLLCIGISVATSVLERIVPFFGIIGGLVGLALLLPQIAVAVRRMHDLDRSGWWIGIPMLLVIPAAGVFGFMGMAALQGDNMGGTMAIVLGIFVVALLAYSILLLVWCCSRGTVGPNRFGPDPLDPAGDLVEVFS